MSTSDVHKHRCKNSWDAPWRVPTSVIPQEETMAWINVIDTAEATGELKTIYEQIEEERGKVSNIMKIHSLNPRAMKAHMDIYLAIMFGQSGLIREERELLGVVVSAANKCDYCVVHHAEALNHYWKDRAKIRQLLDDHTALELPARSEAMIVYAIKLTAMPHTVAEADIRQLRECGFSDEEILNINLITSYFSFVNRIILGLGVESTPQEVTGYTY